MACDKESKKILPINYPAVTSFPSYATLFSLLSNNEEDLIWAYNYFLQLYFDGSLSLYLPYKSDKFFRLCPMVEFCYMEYWLLEQIIKEDPCDLITAKDLIPTSCKSNVGNDGKAFADCIIDAIDKGYYIYLAIDVYEISAYKYWFQKKHYSHPVFLYGYDDTMEHVFIADFFTSKYEFKIATFDEISKGYFNNTNKLKGELYFIRKTSQTQTELDITATLNILNDYVSAENTVALSGNGIRLFSHNCVFGINIYSALIGDLLQKKVDARNFHMLYDHKTILLGLVDQLTKEQRLYDSSYHQHMFLQLKSKALLIRNKVLKAKLRYDFDDYSSICDLLKRLSEEEALAINKLIEDISQDIIQKTFLNACVVEYVGIDKITKGAWMRKYGSLGYDIFGYKRYLKNEISLQYFNTQNGDYLCIDGLRNYMQLQYFNYNSKQMSPHILNEQISIIEKRFLDALEYEGKCKSCIRFGYNLDSFDLHLKVDSIKPIKASLYFMRADRPEEAIFPAFSVNVLDASSGQILYTHEIDEAYSEGVYLTLMVGGHIILRFDKLSEESIPYLAGIFFD